MSLSSSETLPGKAEPYVLRAGGGQRNLVGNQIIRTLAGEAETGGGFGAVICEAGRDYRPIPMHFHHREHDTWFCLRGQLQVWCKDKSRVLHPGDFAYVQPGDPHSYQSVAPRTAFFGIVSPGGWEKFFVEAGEPWPDAVLPPPNRPFDFGRMGAAMRANDVIPVQDAQFAPAAPMDDADRAGADAPSSYYLESGFGRRTLVDGHLVTALTTPAVTAGMIDMRVVEAAEGARMQTPAFNSTALFLFVLEGRLEATLDGEACSLSAGDCANVPAGVSLTTIVASGSARWVVTSSGGEAASLFDSGQATDAFTFPAP